MRPFRFRAQAALQLRRREHDQALAHLARAESALTLAQHRVDEAASAVRAADDTLTAALGAPSRQAPLEWYRSWRVRCCVERDDRERQYRARETDVHDAMRLVHTTAQRVRSLERLHDHALATWRRAADQEERKTMDAIGTTRFTRRKDDV